MIALSDVGHCGGQWEEYLGGWTGQKSERSTIMIKVHFAGNV